MKGRTTTGKFKKGVSGNLSGRPKTDKLTSKDKKELAEMFEESIDNKNKLKKSIIFMVERANLVSDVFKIVKEFAPYITAKLSSVKTEVEQINRIEISTLDGALEPIKIINPQMDLIDYDNKK